MKSYVQWAVGSLYLTVAAFCSAAGFTPVPFNCGMAQGSPVTNLDQRIEVSATGFSVLPPRGENWCVKSLASARSQFLESPGERGKFGQPSSPDELFPVALQALRFTGLAVGLPDFGLNIESPEHVKFGVHEMISMHVFSQFVGGLSSAERRYQLLESHSQVDGSFGASCVRFDAKWKDEACSKHPPALS